MIHYNIEPGTKVRNIRTGKEYIYRCRVIVRNPYSVKVSAILDGLRWMNYETFNRNYEVVEMSRPSLITSLG